MAGEEVQWKQVCKSLLHIARPTAVLSLFLWTYVLLRPNLNETVSARRTERWQDERTQINKYIHENEEDPKDSPTKEKRERDCL